MKYEKPFFIYWIEKQQWLSRILPEVKSENDETENHAEWENDNKTTCCFYIVQCLVTQSSNRCSIWDIK